MFSFDQYQRYKTIARVSEIVKDNIEIDKLKLLEVGANAHRNLEKVVENDEVFYTDISMQPGFENDDHFFIADATNLSNINDNEFDVVVASDVFEHIPEQLRKNFITELYRVSKYGVIMCFPFKEEHIEEAETRANAYYKAIYGDDYIWLYEHIDNGLPSKQSVEEILNSNNISFRKFEHGDISIWEKFIKIHFDVVQYRELSSYREKLDELYINHIYASDVSDKNYRVFYLLIKDKILDDKIENVNLFNSSLSDEIKTKMDFLLGDILKVCQYSFQRRVDNILTKSSCEKVNIGDLNIAIFYDYGNGFNENDKIVFQQKENIGFVDINIPDGVKKVRIDPIENSYIFMTDVICLSGDKKLLFETDGVCYNDAICFDSTDPWLLFEKLENIKCMKLFANIYIFRGEEYGSLFKGICNINSIYKEKEKDLIELQQKLDKKQQQIDTQKKRVITMQNSIVDYEDNYLAAINQRDDLIKRIENVQNELYLIQNAFFWKITYPFRKINDKVKKIIYKNKYTRLIDKGIRSVRNSGISYTKEKVKQKIIDMKQIASLDFSITKEERQIQENTKFDKDVMFSIIVPLYNTPIKFLSEMISSVSEQTYSNWQLCLADGSDDSHSDVGKFCKKLMKKDKRIKYLKLDKNDGISGNTNICLDMADGDFISLFDHDDVLHPAALFEVMKKICEKNADFIYTDELTFEGSIDKIITMHFKPDFSIDNIRANNFICHFTTFSKELLDKTGKFRKEYDGSQDHDMMLRLTANAKHIEHIPKILYYWRSHPASVAADINSKRYAIDAGIRAVRDSIKRCGQNAVVESSKAFPTIYRIKYEILGNPLISIIIPNKNHYNDIKTCIESIITFSTYENYEIIIVDNGTTDEETLNYYSEIKSIDNIKILHWDDEFNYSAINNFAVEYANGEYLLLLNSDTKVITPSWMEEMLMYAQRDDVGAVGAKLYYEDDTIQHAGIILGIGQHRIAGHSHYRLPKENLGYMGRLYYAQNMSAVTAACMMIKKEVYIKVGGLDTEFKVAYNDVDLCMKIRKEGYLIVFTPYAELYHYESKTRGYEDTDEKQKRFLSEVDLFKNKWDEELAKGDPYYNPNFSLDRDDFSINLDLLKK